MSFFKVDITLTENGLQNYDKVIEACFQYFQRLRDAGPQEYIANEIKNIGEMNFKFSDKRSAIDTCE